MTSNQATQRFRVDVGTVDGATLLEWIHPVSQGLATRWSGRQCVAASMGNLHLGRTSMHILLTVHSNAPVLPEHSKPGNFQ